MKINALVSAALGAIIAASAASAAFTGLSSTNLPTTLSDGSPIWVVRLFANFDDPTDRLLSITGASITPTPGSPALYQNPFGTSTEPIGALLIPFPDLAYDSYVTMNKESTLDPGPGTSLEPGSFFSATGFTGGWFTDGDAPQATGQLSYLIAQMSMAGSIAGIPGVEGALTVVWKTATSGAQFTEVNFYTPPAPGTVALLGIAAAAGHRRRR